ncbi:MAG TPA: DUF4911 domain-containing protein [Smithellaceae bacterium]|nr:DUF4911 domain-containing protein [Smithellaceae bacterium]
MLNKIYGLRRENIALVQFIIEGYERLATVSTIDAHQALIQVMIMPDFAAEMAGLLDYLKAQGMIEETV